MSEKMKELLAQLTNLETESKNLINKQDATAEEITQCRQLNKTVI